MKDEPISNHDCYRFHQYMFRNNNIIIIENDSSNIGDFYSLELNCAKKKFLIKIII